MLKADNAILKVEIEELKVRLEGNSHNSNKSPSSDGCKKETVKPAFSKSKGCKKGGQNGHNGHTLQQVEAPDKTVICAPDACTCGHEFEKGQLMLAEKHQVFDLPQPKLEISEYQIFKACCPACGQGQKGVAPQGVNAPVQ